MNDKPLTNEPNAPSFMLERIFLKDASFETPMGIRAFQGLNKPRLKQELQTRSEKLADHVYEVVLTVTVSLLTGEPGKEETAFLIEVQQGGIFRINIADEEQLKEQLGVTCPSILFPYVRETIDALANKGSFQPLLLPPVNFLVVYRKKREVEAAKNSGTAH